MQPYVFGVIIWPLVAISDTNRYITEYDHCMLLHTNSKVVMTGFLIGSFQKTCTSSTEEIGSQPPSDLLIHLLLSETNFLHEESETSAE